MANFRDIQQVHFQTYAHQIVDLIAKNFSETLLFEGISFDRNRRLAQKTSLLFLLDVFHPILTRFGEVFIWKTQNFVSGTGAIIRINLNDAKTWILINFAVSKIQLSKFTVALKMRRLLRIALSHAIQHGATCIQAYVRSDNAPVISLCLKEGFLEIKERVFWSLNNKQIKQIRKTEKEFAPLRWSKQTFPLKHLPIEWLLSYLRGAKKEVYSIYQDALLLGKVKVLIPSIVNSPYRISIDFCENVSNKLKKSIIIQVISICPQNIKTTPSVILSLLFSSCSDSCLPFKLDCPVQKVNRKLLSLDLYH